MLSFIAYPVSSDNSLPLRGPCSSCDRARYKVGTCSSCSFIKYFVTVAKVAGKRALMAHWSRSIRSLLQFSILCSLFINLVATAAVSNDTASSLQSNGVICGKGFFGSPAVDTCRRQISRLPKTSDFQWFESWQQLAGLGSPGPGEQCAIEIGILPGARNNVTWNTLTRIASAVVETCSTLPGAPGGWGAYGTNPAFLSLGAPAMKQGNSTNGIFNPHSGHVRSHPRT